MNYASPEGVQVARFLFLSDILAQKIQRRRFSPVSLMYCKKEKCNTVLRNTCVLEALGFLDAMTAAPGTRSMNDPPMAKFMAFFVPH